MSRLTDSPVLALPLLARPSSPGAAAPGLGWQSDQQFWSRHFWWPLLAAILVLSALEQTPADLWLADRWFALEGGKWAWRNHWISYDLIHHYGKQLIIGIGLLALGMAAASFCSTRWRAWRAPMIYLFTSMAVVPASIALFKRLSPVPCPWDLARYGGALPYVRTFDYHFGPAALGHCFPAGHASGGFILLAAYFAALPFSRRPLRLLLPGLVIGWTFALGQQSRGGHFLSHDLWSLSLCWFGALALFLAFRPHTWRQPAATRPAGE